MNAPSLLPHRLSLTSLFYLGFAGLSACSVPPSDSTDMQTAHDPAAVAVHEARRIGTVLSDKGLWSEGVSAGAKTLNGLIASDDSLIVSASKLHIDVIPAREAQIYDDGRKPLDVRPVNMAGAQSEAGLVAETAAAPKVRNDEPTDIAVESNPHIVMATPHHPSPDGDLDAGAPVDRVSMIQIGSFSTPANARAAWQALQVQFAFLGDYRPRFERVQTAQGGLTRLRIGPVTSSRHAEALCARLNLTDRWCARASA